MTRVSRLLRRLVVVGASTAVVGAGIIPLTEGVASAAAATAISISPTSDTETVGNCNPFTVTTTPAGATFDVQISQTAATAPASTTINFCSVAGFSSLAADANPQNPAATHGNCGVPTASVVAGDTTVKCDGDFTANATTGKVTFGVKSDTPGTMTVVAYNDVNGNNAFDAGGIDSPSATATKTWVASTATTVSCTPKTSSANAGGTQDISCQANTGSGTGINGTTVVRYAVTGGPDTGQTNTCAHTGDATGNFGKVTCTVTNGGTAGTDTVVIYVDNNGNGVFDTGEPSDTVSISFVAAAPTGSTISVTCSPNQTTATKDVCQDDPRADNTATFTATVTNGTTAVAGALVTFTVTDNSGVNADASDTEAVAPTSCTTDATGSCSTTFTDSTAKNGESFTVTGTIKTAAPATVTDSATKNFVTPTGADARNISVAPETASQSAGGLQKFTATVTDRFGNGVPNLNVDWTESGPGAFRTGGSATSCTTAADGTCSVDVTSLSSERGPETVTATISAGGTDCDALGSTTTPNDPAGNCSDSGTVTWTAPPVTAKTRISAVINCFSPRKHVLKCKVHETPARAGLTVVFKRRTASGVHKIGADVTNSNGVAKLVKKGLKSHKVWRVFAHVRSTAKTTGATTNTDRTRIK